jgi:hypothetical protein
MNTGVRALKSDGKLSVSVAVAVAVAVTVYVYVWVQDDSPFKLPPRRHQEHQHKVSKHHYYFCHKCMDS